MRLIEHKLNKYFSTKWQKESTKINIELNDEGRVTIPGNEVLKNQEKVKKKKTKSKDKEKEKREGEEWKGTGKVAHNGL